MNHQITSLHFSQTCKEIVSLTGFRSPDQPIYSRDKRLRPLLPQTPKKQRRRTSLAFITRPQPHNAQQAAANAACTFEPPTSTADQPKIRPFCIVTHRYPSLQHVQTVPNRPFIRMTMGALSPDGTMLLTAGAEALSLRTVWGKAEKTQETDEGFGDANLIR